MKITFAKQLANLLLLVGLVVAPAAQAGLINGGFEGPFIADNSWGLFTNVTGWKTTATDSNIELWGNGFSSSSGGAVYAYEGRQFAEINATQFATLYQDVSGISAGSIVGFKFAHRGRSGVDTMRLTITDLGVDNLIGTLDDAILFSKDYSDGNTGWGFYTSAGLPAITALGHTTRFSYAALTTASGSISVGNFIDAADFGVGVAASTVPEPASLALLGLGLAGLGFSRRRKA